MSRRVHSQLDLHDDGDEPIVADDLIEDEEDLVQDTPSEDVKSSGLSQTSCTTCIYYDPSVGKIHCVGANFTTLREQFGDKWHVLLGDHCSQYEVLPTTTSTSVNEESPTEELSQLISRVVSQNEQLLRHLNHLVVEMESLKRRFVGLDERLAALEILGNPTPQPSFFARLFG